MISVPIDRIVPLTDARDNFSRLISDIETLSDGLYVLTKGGKPAIALINIKYLEEIMTSGPAANHQARIANHESDHKPEVSHKVHEPIHRPAPVKLPEPPKPPIIPKPNFEVPRITTAPISPSIPLPSTPSTLQPVQGHPDQSGGAIGLRTGVLPSTPLGVNGDNTPKVAPPFSNYDVKPTVNPTWTGEEAKTQPLASSSLAPSQNPSPFTPVPKPFDSAQVKPEASSPSTPLGVNQLPDASLPPIAQFDKPTPFDSAQGKPPPPPTPSKPTINPWPIIPPRSPQVTEKGYEPTTTVPPRPTPPAQPSTIPPSAPSGGDGGFPAESPSTGLGVNRQPMSSLRDSLPAPLKVATSPAPAPLPPLPPLPAAPETTYPKMVAPPPPPPPSSLPRIPSSFQTVPVPINGSKPPTTPPVPLPPPPITTAPAPFADTSSAAPIVTPSTPSTGLGTGGLGVNTKPTDSISFDQPPTTIPEPGEDLPMPSAAKTDPPAVGAPIPPATPAPATPPPSVQDLEI